jgi:hypothetical protein
MLSAMCAENVIRIDLVKVSLNVGDDGRTASLLSELAPSLGPLRPL